MIKLPIFYGEGEPEVVAWYWMCREGVWAGKEMERRLPNFS